MIKRSMHQESITIINTYAPNVKGSKDIKHILADLKGETGNKSKTVKNFNTPFSAMARSSCMHTW